MNEPRFILFGGKGGTGKTTLAAATALDFADKNIKTLIVSIDPAHSLSDVFGKSVGSKPVQLNSNLYALELNPAEALKEKHLISTTLQEILKALEIDDLDILDMLPGIDEAMAYDKLVEYFEGGGYDTIIFDTAPTGHTLRFLSIPGLMDVWIRKVYRARTRLADMLVSLRRYIQIGRKEVERPSYWGEHLERQRAQRVHKALTDPLRTSFFFVMLPEKASICETRRALDALLEYRIPVKGIIVNQVLPENSACALCRARRLQQEENLQIIRHEFKGLEMREIPVFDMEIRGFDMLRKCAGFLSY